MKKILLASIVLSSLAYLTGWYTERVTDRLQRIAAGLPLKHFVIPNMAAIPRDPIPRTEFDEHEFRPMEDDPTTQEPVDPWRRQQGKDAVKYKAVSSAAYQVVWVFPVLGLILIVLRTLERARIKWLEERESVTAPGSDAKSEEMPNTPGANP